MDDFDWTPVFEQVRNFLTVVLPALAGYLAWLLHKNTKITEEVRKQTNGDLAKARDAAQRLQLERDAYRDMVRFVNSHPEGRKVLLEYAERRKVRTHDATLDALLVTAVMPAHEATEGGNG